MSRPTFFRYQAIANNGRAREVFTSVEYVVGNQLPLGIGGWTIERVEAESVERNEDEILTTRRTLYCDAIT
jgi:hypothetical protein